MTDHTPAPSLAELVEGLVKDEVAARGGEGHSLKVSLWDFLRSRGAKIPAKGSDHDRILLALGALEDAAQSAIARLEAENAALRERVERADGASTSLMAAIRGELDHAYRKHGRDPWGRHEFYAILLEEVDELKEAIWKDAPQQEVLAELRQVAAMCFRYVETGDRYRGDHPPVPSRVALAAPKGGDRE